MSLSKQTGNADPSRSKESFDSPTIAGESGTDGQTGTIERWTKEATPGNHGGLGQSTLPQDRVAREQGVDAEKTISDGWNEDPRNPRLWSAYRKWASAAIVSLYTLVS
jgi:hypothetical protein